MRRSDLTGTGKVFRFTLMQYLKARSTIITMLVMVLAVIGSVFIAGYSMGAGEQAAGVISSVAFRNTTGVPLTAGDIAAYDPYYSGLYETWTDDADVLIVLYEEEGAYHVRAEGAVDISELMRMENAASGAFGIVAAGGRVLSGNALTLEEYLEPAAQEDDFAASFTVSYVYSILVMVLTMLSSSYIIRSVLEEKASRLVEMLMVSVKPLALILGKILASMCLVIIQLALLAAGGFLAAKLAGSLLGSTGLIEMVTGTGVLASLQNLNAFSVIAALISILLGFLTLALVGGLSASCCDSMDDINSASTVTMFTAIGGYMVGIFAGSFGSGSASVIFSLIPVVSVFVAPVKYLEGDISVIVLLAAWVIQIAVIAGLAHITRRTYAALIMHTGGRVKLRHIFRVAGIGGGR